jgi:hypothetical protein
MAFDVVKAKSELRAGFLKMRDNVQRASQTALRKGDRERARSLDAELRKLDETIAELDRNA